jgi:hypothetical protein
VSIGDGLGQMESSELTETNADGTFTISLSSRDRVLFALTSDRKYGCITEVSDNVDKEPTVVMRLARLFSVNAEFPTSVEGKSIDWCHAYVELPPDENNPLASNRFMAC